ncbi:MAG: flagellar assembly protein T N-terminal domain-containing protein [Pseudomonadota bacterium]
MKTLSKAILCFLLILISAYFAHGEELLQSQVITSEGIGAIINNDKAMARDNAVEDALRKAVEQAVGTIVSSETMVENFQLLNDRIYTKTEGYIQKYKIISETSAENIYKVIVEATVTLGNLKNDLATIGLLMARKHKPRVMVMIAEQNIGQQYLSFWWGHKASEANLSIAESVLVEKLREKGFNLVDHAAKAENIRMSKLYRVANLDDNTAVSLGNQYDAEVVIVGKALAKLAGSVMGTSMKSVQANISARAIRTDNGAIIASANSHGAAVHIDEVTGGTEALKKASYDLASQLIDQIISTWGQEVSGTTMVQLTINGVSRYKDFTKLKNILQEQVRGVKGVYQRNINAGVAKVDIDIKGDSQSLADELSSKNFGDFSINITSISQNSLELTIIPKNQ